MDFSSFLISKLILHKTFFKFFNKKVIFIKLKLYNNKQ